ncbi:MAG: hypothetical protein JWP44_4171, partial [Mucilaginibacter sp.]|nr:hypothetical protein [Mucilaginibacter sp.]
MPKQKRIIFFFVLFIACFLLSNTAFAQTGTCPLNIDFEAGSFQNWQCYKGTTSSNGTTNIITVNPTAPTAGVHEIIAKGTRVDPYGGFPVSAPDGSTYSVKLGNDGVNSQAERISYLFTVPLNQTDYVITYQYAVVLQDPGHPPSQQPRFTAKVFDLTTNTYVTCGSFDYVATAALPGFLKAKTYASNQVIYKNWTPVSINLNGYQGHQLRLEFTTADCTVGGHFGYAYVDVNNSCSSLITGNYICFSKPTFTLLGPAGFNQYNWYTADRSTLLGTGRSLTLPTTIADNTTILLDLIPFTGFGCNYTISTVIHKIPNISFSVTDPAPACVPATVDITNASVTKNSDANLVYSYWQDPAGSLALLSPNAINTTGTYYIKATSPSGCFDIEPVNAVVS